MWLCSQPGGRSASGSRGTGFQHIGFDRQQAPAAFASQLQHVLMVLQHARTVSGTDISDLCRLQQAIKMFFILYVQRTGGFIEHGVLRLGEEQAGKGQELLFSQGQDIGPVQLHVPAPNPLREFRQMYLFQHM